MYVSSLWPCKSNSRGNGSPDRAKAISSASISRLLRLVRSGDGGGEVKCVLSTAGVPFNLDLVCC